MSLPFTLPNYARQVAQTVAPPGTWWPAVIDDFARFGWTHLGTAPHQDGHAWFWMHGQGGVLVVLTDAGARVCGMSALEGDEARRILDQSPAKARLQGGPAVSQTP